MNLISTVCNWYIQKLPTANFTGLRSIMYIQIQEKYFYIYVL